MFLIDSSVWIEYLKPKGSAKIKEKIRELLSLGVVVSCGIVAVEILRGARNKRDFDELYDSFYSLPQIPIDKEVIVRASRWGFEMDRKGKVVSTTDLIIASVAYKKARLLHIDNDFKMIAEFFNLEEEILTR
ncbi:MAG: nucleic acid-binding protein contains PIN domain protein [Candidatus Scalindua rubra]|uniref:Nucleic acid-binding protein contains PIN domain protein n=1 Tax=Candidatus Scalindua rubra TaxID=1872076 RepID=A0A1E3X8L7_9BACT|nr:MAG: nucleic acid-binding protein contains PIN domain protein [Candidatus Scalindua rubra]